MATNGWTVLIGPALLEYTDVADLGFTDRLYDFGAARVSLWGLSGHAAPARGDLIQLVYDKGLSSEQTHWQGYIDNAQQMQEGNAFSIQAYTLDALLHSKNTGAIRNFKARAPHSIIQGGGAPPDILRDSQTNIVLTYGAAAGVPLKVDAGTPGIMSGTLGTDQFITDTGTLFNNVRRLCWQSIYDRHVAFTADAGSTASTLKDAALVEADRYWAGAVVKMTSGANNGLSRLVSTFTAATDTCTLASAFPAAIAAGDTYTITIYGLEWTTTIEAGPAARFYLMKRRERSSSYTPEIFHAPDDFHFSKRGTPLLPGIDAIRIIGAGDGNSRIDSGLVGAGDRESTLMDKSILKAANAVNMATRLQQVYDRGTELISAQTMRHNSPTRAGDSVSFQQTGFSAVQLRVIERYYTLKSRTFTFQLGRPLPLGRDALQAVTGAIQADQSSPQFTDLQLQGAYDPATPNDQGTFGAIGNVVIAAGATYLTPLGSFPATMSGDVEGVLFRMFLYCDATSASFGSVVVQLLARIAGADVLVLNTTVGDVIPGAGPSTVSYPFDIGFPYPVSDASNNTVVTEWRLNITNRDPVNAFTMNNNTFWKVFGKPKHQHNTLP